MFTTVSILPFCETTLGSILEPLPVVNHVLSLCACGTLRTAKSGHSVSGSQMAVTRTFPTLDFKPSLAQHHPAHAASRVLQHGAFPVCSHSSAPKTRNSEPTLRHTSGRRVRSRQNGPASSLRQRRLPDRTLQRSSTFGWVLLEFGELIKPLDALKSRPISGTSAAKVNPTLPTPEEWTDSWDFADSLGVFSRVSPKPGRLLAHDRV